MNRHGEKRSPFDKLRAQSLPWGDASIQLGFRWIAAVAKALRNDRKRLIFVQSRLHTRPVRVACLLLPLISATLLAEAPAYHRTFDFDHDPKAPSANFVHPAEPFSTHRGYGFDLNTRPNELKAPFYFSAVVPEGNYRVNVTFGHRSAPTSNTVKAESRQLMIERVDTQPNEFTTRTFIVNVRNSRIPPPEKNAPGGNAVLLNDRETGLLRWDDKLTIEFNGAAPGVQSLDIEQIDVPTVFLAGDSTVTDQPFEPGASWGQMLPRFFKPVLAVANHAESGETMKSFISGLRLAKLLSQSKPGDYVFIQFGHNDQKKNWPQTYVEANTTYKAYLRAFIAEAKLRGMTPVLVTSMQRRNFDAQNRIKNTHGEYPQAVRDVAREENVILIDLEQMSIALYEALGPEKAPLAFSNSGKDATHHNNYGAYELAKCVMQGIRNARLPLTDAIAEDFTPFDPAHPDSPDSLVLPASPARSDIPPRGN